MLVGILGATGALALALAGVSGAAVLASIAVGLPEPAHSLDDITFDQQSGIYDRSGTILLARLGSERREVVDFESIPPELIDATTAIEDNTFWNNPGVDPFGVVSAALDTLQGDQRGASTITMQFVRSRLLPAPPADLPLFDRKAMEFVQAIRLTNAYPGRGGKQRIIATYLNDTFYGNESYGVSAAARGYWNIALSDLTLAQAALLAAIPQSPSAFDLVANAREEPVTDDNGREATRLVVPPSAAVVRRRNYILELMKTRSELSGANHTVADYEMAMFEPVILDPPPALTWRAPHFVWQVRRELARILCNDVPVSCPAIETGGYRVRTTLDERMQRITERWVYAAAVIPNLANPRHVLKERHIPRSEWSWILALRGHAIHNGAAAVMDSRTGDVLAYVGSASYRAKGNRHFRPAFDVLADGWRQPGSAIKPLGYLVGIDDQRMTAATMFMDVVTNFAPAGARAWYPIQADRLE
ncbi:MAG TPA: transglycosylase domain-containing protein, partial [Candidatus Limnocylindrales bacterium]|nr:transglycosylase domain-containing protein [Candidatus Limnocylindrales bacterium]